MREDQIVVGGQAVVEGVMMRAPHSYAVAVRRFNGEIVTRAEPLPQPSERYPALKLPLLRGAAVLIQSMVLGIKALNFSTGVAYEDALEQEAAEKAAASAGSGSKAGANKAPVQNETAPATPPAAPLPFKPDAASGGESANSNSAGMPKVAAIGSTVFGLAMSVVMFLLLPLLITNVLFVYLGNGAIHGHPGSYHWYAEAFAWLRAALKPIRPTVAFNVVDGLIRMTFFLVMIWSMSRLKEMKRVFQYHGAEHKVVHTWEAGEELTVDNARRKPRQHPRCGTSFLMLVMLVAIATFSIVRFDSLGLNFLARILLIPVIAGFSYEILRASAKSSAQLMLTIITRPGLWLQNITTREPDDSQLEVSITALKESLKVKQPAAQVLAA
ncbi:MAG TPA: DUF1385 domain-containing protein [Blastocatellia bacterium]|nr:DUF1385 domain-containing protein [Blastocatellia bacterium]